MLKMFLGLTLEEAIEEAVRQGREYEYFEEDEWSDARLQVSTMMGNGAALWFEDGVIVEYEFSDWT